MTSTSVELGSENGAAATAAPVLGSVARFVVGLAGWTATLAALIAAIGLGVLPHLGVYRTLTVLSASMKPTFSPGDIVVVRPEPIERLRVGQVISYAVPVGAHQVETHRVVEILRGQGTTTPVVQTKGDNNTVVDPWTAQLNGSTVWRLEAVVPKAGETHVTIHPTARVGARACTMIESTHPQKRASYLYYSVKVYLDHEHGLPIRIEAYDWPKRPGQAPDLLEEYTYSNLRINAGLTEHDFDPANKQYSFGRF